MLRQPAEAPQSIFEADEAAWNPLPGHKEGLVMTPTAAAPDHRAARQTGQNHQPAGSVRRGRELHCNSSRTSQLCQVWGRGLESLRPAPDFNGLIGARYRSVPKSLVRNEAWLGNVFAGSEGKYGMSLHARIIPAAADPPTTTIGIPGMCRKNGSDRFTRILASRAMIQWR